MSVSEKFHATIMNHNVLTKPAQQISKYFAKNPQALKVALICNHIFRTIAMTGFMLMLPFSFPVSAAICIAGALFYRLTVESNCAYKFALPSAIGAPSLLFGKAALSKIITGVAFTSFNALGATCIGIIPLSLYTAYVMLTVNHDVDNRSLFSCIRR